MQDRFRFRAWKKNDKTMIYNAEFAYDTMTMNNGLLIDITQEYPVFQLDYFGEYLEYYPYYEVMQCTGLKDKNGKLIYEGDILGGTYGNLYVHYCDSCKQFQLKAKYYGCMACEGDIHWFELVKSEGENELEVIGNIYQNPELLEVQNADNE